MECQSGHINARCDDMPVKPWSYDKLPAKLNKLPVSVNKIPAKLNKLPVNLERYGIELWRFHLIALRAHYTKKDKKKEQNKDVEAHIHLSPSNHLKIIEGFHVTSYQANFARHQPSDHHVGFLSPKSGKGKFNKMSLNVIILFKSQYHYHTTTEWQEY